MRHALLASTVCGLNAPASTKTKPTSLYPHNHNLNHNHNHSHSHSHDHLQHQPMMPPHPYSTHSIWC